jgi:adenylosuccinate lyase
MSRIWEPENKFRLWLEIELAACEGWERLGKVPKGTAARVRKKAWFDPSRIDELEKTVHHDVIAFLTSIAESAGPEARFLHIGMTSSDVLDTCFSLQLKRSAEILDQDLESLLKVFKKRADEFSQTPMIGRTHGVHAEPITFGLKIASWYEEFVRQRKRLAEAKEEVSVGKISGAVGTYSHLEPEVERTACQKLGLKPETISTQVISRDRYAFFFSVLAGIASSVEKVATEIRHLQRTEVREVEEYFAEGQKGSSAMPHKRNPIRSENLCGLARLVRSTVVPALENVSLWHERDISHSSVERVIGPDATILTDFMLVRLKELMEKLIVYPKKMKENLEKMGGLIYSEGVLLRLVQSGLSREEAYRLVQNQAMACWKNGVDFSVAARKDPTISKKLSKQDFDEIFDLKESLRYVDTVFKRVFG